MVKLFFSVLFCVTAFGFLSAQNWYLNKVNKGKVYKYEYWFGLQNLLDTNSYSSKFTATNDSTYEVRGYVLDSKNNSILYGYLTIYCDNEKKDSIDVDIDSLGYFETKVHSKNFEITINLIMYDQFKQKISFPKSGVLNLKINLGMAPEDAVYQINSKVKLKAEEIEKIINCVQINRNFKEYDCLDKEIGYISFHI